MAIELIQANAIFYEIPKTGTTFVRHALTELGIEWRDVEPIAPVCPRHSLPDHYPDAFVFKFCAVRHPVTWYESYWRMASNAARIAYDDNLWYAHRVLGDGMPPSFTRWIYEVTDGEPAFLTRLVEAFVGPFGYPKLNAVMRQERLADNLSAVLLSLGYGDHELSGMPKVAASGRPRPRWDAGLKGRVCELESPLLRRFYSES